MAQQTAVEWFYQRILANNIEAVYQQAKKMEKQQKKYAWVDGNGTQMCITSKDVDECFDDYYTQTYGK
jgi:hypothetical protein